MTIQEAKKTYAELEQQLQDPTITADQTKFVALSKMFFERPEPLAYSFETNPNTATD